MKNKPPTVSKSIPVSIIMGTRNRKEILGQALESLRNLDYPKDRLEVLVVDDGSTDGTGAMVREMMETAGDLTLHYHRQPCGGISSARNNGIRRARGELLVFIDDDCTCEPDWLTNLVMHYDSPDVGIIGGPDKAPPGSSLLLRCADFAITSFVGTGGVRRREGMRLARYYPRGFNMVVPRAVLLEAGYFDETLSAGEEIDLCYRIAQLGYSIRYASDAPVWHKRRNSLTGWWKQIFIRGYTRVELARRHRELMEIAYLLPAGLVLGFILLSGLALRYTASRRMLRSALLTYTAILLAAGLQAVRRIGDVRAVMLVPLVLALQHAAYGLGFLGALPTRNRSAGEMYGRKEQGG